MALGTWGMSGEDYGPVYHREVDRIIDRAIELGITLFDTADVYAGGKLEEKLAERLDPAEHRVITKIGTFVDCDPPRKKFDAESLRVAFEKSRERLKRVLLVEAVDVAEPLEDHLEERLVGGRDPLQRHVPTRTPD